VKTEYETVCADAEAVLLSFAIQLSLTWMVRFLLEYAQTGLIDPDELQDLAEEIRSGLDERVEG